jgi:DNA-binding response OmpR family regulator
MSTILFVEDNADHAQLVIRVLRAAGYEVRHTPYGLESPAMSQQQRPDLILMDFDLPDVDGRKMIRVLREQLGEHLAPPIVAVTAHNDEVDVQMSRQLGCAAFVSKPFAPDELLALVRQLLSVQDKVQP